MACDLLAGRRNQSRVRLPLRAAQSVAAVGRVAAHLPAVPPPVCSVDEDEAGYAVTVRLLNRRRRLAHPLPTRRHAPWTRPADSLPFSPFPRRRSPVLR